MKLKNLIPNSINESSLSRVVHHMNNHDCGVITAFRSKEGCAGQDDPEYSLEDNLKRNRQLQAKLQVLGYGVTKVDGSYIENFKTPNAKEVKEASFFVVDLKDGGKLEQDLRKFGEEFMQDSILFIPKREEGKIVKGSILIGTNKCPDAYPGYGKKVQFKDMTFGKDAEFMTKVSGRPFTFESNFYEQTKNAYNYFAVANIMGKMAMKKIAEGNWRDISPMEDVI
jgi:hypothetical protein